MTASAEEQPAPNGRSITISLAIGNRYEGGLLIPTQVINAVIPAPPMGGDVDAMEAWAYDYVFPFTGTSRTHGDSWYDVTVTGCSDSSLTGSSYAFGY